MTNKDFSSLLEVIGAEGLQRIIKGGRRWHENKEWTENPKRFLRIRAQYPNQWIAIYNKKIVAHSKDRTTLYDETNINSEDCYEIFASAITL